MASTIERTENAVVDLRQRLKDMPMDMRIFSLSMRSLYVKNAVGSSGEAVEMFRKLRDDTRNDAMVYLKGILPLSKSFVESTRQYFMYFDALEYNEWCAMLPTILEETVELRQLCETLLAVHEDIMVSLKQRAGQAMLVIKELQGLQEVFKKKKSELIQNAQIKDDWAKTLLLIPIIGSLVSKIFQYYSLSDISEAIAKGTEGEIQVAAIFAVGEELIPALNRFMKGISTASSFFSIMETQIRSLEDLTNKGKEPGAQKLLFYKIMAKEAKDMKSICQDFFATLPEVKTDFEAIPTEGTDQNYVDRWLEKQKKTIIQKCSVAALVRKLLKAIEGKW